MYTPFDFNEAIAHRKEYIDDRLRGGSPVVGLAYDGGLVMLTVRRTQRKIYEIYDRQMFSAIGNQSDIENIRLSAIQIAHQEGFERSPDDVSVHRLVGFALSPALKKAYGDQLTVPFVVRALFAELGRTPDADMFYTLNYDGEFRRCPGAAAIAGSQVAEDRMLERLGDLDRSRSRDDAISTALGAWTAGARESLRRHSADRRDDFDDDNPLRDNDDAVADSVFLRDEMKTGSLEVGILERRGARGDSRFRFLTDSEMAAFVK